MRFVLDQHFAAQDARERPVVHRDQLAVIVAQLEHRNELAQRRRKARQGQVVQRGRGMVRVGQPALGRHDDDAFGQVREHGLELRLALRQCLQGFLARGDVGQRALPDDAAVGVGDGLRVHGQPDVAALRVPDAKLGVQGLQRALRLVDLVPQPAVIRVQEPGGSRRVDVEPIGRHAEEVGDALGAEREAAGSVRPAPERVQHGRGDRGDAFDPVALLLQRGARGPGVLDVGAGAEPAHDAAGAVALRQRTALEPEVRAIEAPESKLGIEFGLGRDRGPPSVEDARSLVRVQAASPLLAQQQLDRLAGVAHPLRAEVVADAVCIEGPHQLRKTFREHAELLLGRPRQFLGMATFDDVLGIALRDEVLRHATAHGSPCSGCGVCRRALPGRRCRAAAT